MQPSIQLTYFFAVKIDITVLQGCGFATFALKEDATRAIIDLNGKSVGGRMIQVTHTSLILNIRIYANISDRASLQYDFDLISRTSNL